MTDTAATELVDPARIESIVGVRRADDDHVVRDADDGRTYMLHSRRCVQAHDDLRDCPYSVALGRYGLWGDVVAPTAVVLDDDGLLVLGPAA